MYAFLIKYKQVVINSLLLLFLILAGIGFARDFFLGAASGAVFVMLGESIGHLKKSKQQERESDEMIFE